jgi:DNA polymerase-3 subunit delta'
MIEKALIETGTSPEKSHLLGRLSQGRPGWALAAAADELTLTKRGERIERLLVLLESSIGERFEYASELSTRFSQKRDDVLQTLEEWLGLWRDLLLYKSGMSEDISNLDYSKHLQIAADGFNINEIRTGINAISKAVRQLHQNSSPRLVLEVLMLDMPTSGAKKNHPGR